MTKLSVKKPFTVLVAVVLVFVLGIVSFTRLNTDLLPKMDLPYVIAMTTAPGASPERVETTVTQPLESVLATTSGLENMQSISMENASIIIMEFSQNVNMDSAMIEMSSSIDMVEGYFEDTVSTPMLMKLNPDMLPVQVLSVDMDGMDIKELSAYIENEITPYLERIDGVATVDVTGLVQDYVSIELNQEKIDAVNDQIIKAVSNELYKTKKDLDEAKQELADGKKELEDGKKELADGKNEAFGKLAEGEAALDSGIAQLQAIMSEKSKLEAQKAMLDNDQMKTAFAGLDGLRTLSSGFKAFVGPFLESAVITADNTLTDIETNILPILSAEQQQSATMILQQLKAMFSADSKIAVVDSGLAGQITAIETQLASAGIKADIISGGSAALTKAVADLASELTQATLMATQMQTTVGGLQAQYAALEKAQMEATAQMAVAEAQIANLEATLEKGEKELESGLE
ncbi:MAG: efflux RND transporter permease subunit, partial [Oscillospiraceae bacterium]|nr:efflux RND transporter permease subunit [Oscillospiraceae bacterium]